MWIRSVLTCCAAAVSIGWVPAGTVSVAADHVVIILDDSGSMNQTMPRTGIRKMDGAKKALASVIQQIPDSTRAGILLLNGARPSHWLVPLGPLNKQQATTQVNKIYANGGTPLGEAMRIAADELLRARSKSVYGTYRLIVVTDGEATDRQLLEQYLPDILSRGLIVDAIGVNMPSNHSLATRVHSYRSADDEVALSNAIVEILAENNDRDNRSSEADFEMLNALNDVDAGEILKALATPNNEAVTGVYSTRAPVENTAAPAPGGFQPGPATVPPSIPSNSSPQTDFFSMAFGTFCTCLLPILVAIMVFVTVVSRGNKKPRR